MSKTRILLLILGLFCVGYSTFTAVRFILSGVPFTIDSFITYMFTTTFSTMSTVITFVLDNIATVGTAITGAAVAYRLVQNKITNVEQKAATKVADAENLATEQAEEMQGTIDSQTEQIGTLETKMSSLQTKADDYDALQLRFDEKEKECQKLIGERNGAQQVWEQFGVTCPHCGTKYLKYLPKCPTCAKPYVVA